MARETLRNMLEKDTVVLAAATAASLFSGTTATGYRYIRITNLTGGVLYVEEMAARTTTPTVSTTDYSFQMAVGESTVLAADGTIGIAGYSVDGGNVRVQVMS